ncbi:MAG: DNA methyltransferase [Methylococcales bacterium]|nr:DNA methyltransferase [Methylococcales bacterium]
MKVNSVHCDLYWVKNNYCCNKTTQRQTGAEVSRLTDLIAQAKAKDPQLGADLDREFKALSSRLPFGLNFERHRPEVVELPQRPIRKGDKVRVLPERGLTKKGDPRLWQIKAIHKTGEGKMADLELLGAEQPELRTVGLDDLVVIAEFRDTIYPGLVSTGKVHRGGDKPFHTVINGENYHVLKALTYTHRGKVDVIYIDPPYNSGARDWKYNNDYVEGDDLYRHSKWLAMIERRLLVAKELLNPADSVLIVTIDEKEYLRLGLLLEQMFPEARIQMVSSVINHSGVARAKEFYRADEYLFFVFLGEAAVTPTGQDMLNPPESFEGKKIDLWRRLLRSGTDARREDSERQFYPFWIDPKRECIHSVGDYIPLQVNSCTVTPPLPELVACWPIRLDDSEGRWQISAETARKGLKEGTVRLGAYTRTRGRWSISYLRNAEKERIKRGELEVISRDQNGALILKQSETVERVKNPVSVWNQRSHNAGAGGSNVIRSVIPGRRFPFPKSLYAVEDALRFFVASKPDAVVLDFFSGSGTTAHAVIRLNRQDRGRRQCISVTNNEVAANEQKALREQGLRPGDAEWEQHGICDYITKPRVQATITGKTPDGKPIKGDYKFADEFPMAEGFEENAEFFTLTYETPVSVSHNHAFARIAPLLWLRAGSGGRRIDKLPDAGWEVVESYGLLVDVDSATPFIKAVGKTKDLRMAYIVTDDDRRFQAIAHRLPDSVEPVRLYESYLSNFSFANGE